MWYLVIISPLPIAGVVYVIIVTCSRPTISREIGKKCSHVAVGFVYVMRRVIGYLFRLLQSVKARIDVVYYDLNIACCVIIIRHVIKNRAIPYEKQHFSNIENWRLLQNYDFYNCMLGIKLKSSSLSLIWWVLQWNWKVFAMKISLKTWF